MIHKEGQNLNFFIPINKLKDLMKANKEKMDGLIKNLGKQYWNSAKNADKNAQAFLGNSFYYGVNYNKDYKRAVYWFAKTRDPIFYDDIAIMYLTGGFGLKKDYEKAKEYALCSLDDHEKSWILGVMYHKGLGFKIDKDKALNYFLKAIKQGDISAFNFEIVGKLFLEKGIPLRAVYWFSLSLVTMHDSK